MAEQGVAGNFFYLSINLSPSKRSISDPINMIPKKEVALDFSCDCHLKIWRWEKKLKKTFAVSLRRVAAKPS